MWQGRPGPPGPPGPKVRLFLFYFHDVHSQGCSRHRAHADASFLAETGKHGTELPGTQRREGNVPEQSCAARPRFLASFHVVQI